MVMVSRGLVVAIVVIGYIIALVQPPAVFTVVIFATSVLGSAFAPAFVCAVWWKKANTPGAIASMVAGALTSVVWELGNLAESTTLAPMFAGLTASTLAIVVVSLATQRVAPVPKHIVAALEEAAEVGPIPKELLARSDFALSPEAGEIRAILDREGEES
jgi:sodium/proline symporter